MNSVHLECPDCIHLLPPAGYIVEWVAGGFVEEGGYAESAGMTIAWNDQALRISVRGEGITFLRRTLRAFRVKRNVPVGFCRFSTVNAEIAIEASAQRPMVLQFIFTDTENGEAFEKFIDAFASVPLEIPIHYDN